MQPSQVRNCTCSLYVPPECLLCFEGVYRASGRIQFWNERGYRCIAPILTLLCYCASNNFRITLLKMWEVRNGHLATYRQLDKYLRDASETYSVETLYHELRARLAQPIQHISARAIAEEAGRLQDNFVTVVAHMKISFKEKEAESTTFLTKFKTLLTTLPLSNKHERLYFLKEEKKCIDTAKDVEEILDILDPHWNYREYAFLERIIEEFGTSELKKEMKEYVAELENFEKTTSVEDYNSAAQDKIEIPAHFKELAITQSKDPAQCSLYDVRQLKDEIVGRSTLTGYAVFLKSASPSSVKIVLAFPPDAYEEVLEALDEKFMKMHQLQVKPHPSIYNHTHFT